MKYLLIIIPLNILTLSVFGQECKKLGDGQYYFKYKGPKKSTVILIIKGDHYSLTQDGQKDTKGKIEWWDDNCMFKLISDEVEGKEKVESLNVAPKTDSIKVLLTNSDTVWRNTFLSRSYCYELIGGRKFRLTYCDNIHITSGEGRIKKK